MSQSKVDRTLSNEHRKLLEEFLTRYKSPIPLLLAYDKFGKNRVSGKAILFLSRRAGLTSDEIEQECLFGLIKAIKKWDRSRGVKFETYARMWMISALQDKIEIEERFKQRHSQSQGSYTTRRGFRGRVTGAGGEEVDMVMKGSSVLHDPADPNTSREALEEIESAAFARKHVHEALSAISCVSCARTRRIIEGYYGLNGQPRKTLRELGVEHKVTKERVRQIKLQGVRMINDYLARRRIDVC